MALPVLTCRIDWTNSGAFNTVPAIDTVLPMAGEGHVVTVSTGRSADLGDEAIGELAFDLANDDDRYTPDRNWADNPSFEAGVEGWETAASSGLTAAATSITQVTDNAPSAGSKAGEAVLTATVNSGVHIPITYRFRNGVAHSGVVYLKSVSGNLNVRAGLASAGTPADIGSTSANITTSWAAYPFTFTPTADRTDVVLFVRTTTAAVATVRIDAIQVNPGTAANAYVEGPTKGQLVPARPVHLYATYGGTDYALFYGFIERITTNPVERTVTITCYDMLRRLAETDVVVAATQGYTPTARDLRVAVLADFERGNVNLLHNPSFETATSGWAQTGTSLTRSATDPAPGGGSAHAAFTASAALQVAYIPVRNAPAFHEGQVYRASVYLRVASGTALWNLYLGTGITSADSAVRTVLVTTTWQRFTVTYTMPTTVTPGTTSPLLLTLQSIASGTVRIDNAAVTRGQPLYPYAATGTGRYPSFLENGGFDGGMTGWTEAYANLLGSNPSFETNTTGWATTGDAFTTAGAIARTTAAAHIGSGALQLTAADAGDGAFFAITGTFTAGVTHDWGVFVRDASGSFAAEAGIGSQGTPADFASAVNATTGTGFTLLTGTWTPSSNRTDAHFYVQDNTGGGNISYWDAAYVFRRTADGTASSGYVNVGPGTTGGVPPAFLGLSLDPVKYGQQSLGVTPDTAATSGVVYDFSEVGTIFGSGVQFTFSAWVYPQGSNLAYKFGIGARVATTGAYDEATTTGTATAGTWTQLSVTWTPSADRAASTFGDVVGFLWSTAASGPSFYVDGVRVITAAAADDFELGQWDLDAAGEGEDVYLSGSSLGGSALSALSTLNALTLTRHWIRYEMAAPWYTYVTEGRDTFAAKTSSETFTEDVQGWEQLDIDRASILNVVPISYAGGTEYYTDAASLDAYGLRPASAIDGSTFYPSAAIPDVIGAAYLARYAQPRVRPTMTSEDRFPAVIARDLDDLITVTIARFMLYVGEFVILRRDLTIDMAARHWRVQWVLEEFAY